jgi:hypothetical protein
MIHVISAEGSREYLCHVQRYFRSARHRAAVLSRRGAILRFLLWDSDGGSSEINVCNYPERWAAIEYTQTSLEFDPLRPKNPIDICVDNVPGCAGRQRPLFGEGD